MIASCLILTAWLGILLLAQRKTFSIALLGFPGVLLHELMHLLVGLILLARPVALNLWPQRQGHEWHFGSVSFTGLNLVNAAPVAYAPLLLLYAAWLFFHHTLLPLYQSEQYGLWALSAYLSACAIFYSPPSSTDLKVAGWSTLFWLTLCGISAWLYLHFQRGLL